MSRTNPSKQKPCSAKRTALLVGEGTMEYAFLCHIKNCFMTRDAGISVKVENTHGGSPETVVKAARKLLTLRDYDRCLVLMDTDRPWPQSRPQKVGRTHITYVAANPCLEGFLLTILQHKGIAPASATVDRCKRAFYDNYIPENKRTEPRAYEKHFTKEFLKGRRSACSELDMILKHLE